MKQKLLAVLCALFTVQMAAWAEEKSGYCGVSTVNDGMDVKWVLSEDSVLTISGKGEMEDYSLRGMPWQDYRQGISKVVIEQGVTSIGNNAFRSCTALKTAIIPNSVARLGRNCFMGCNVVNATIDITFIGDNYDENGELIQDFSNSNLQNHLRNLTIGRSVEGFSLSIIRRLDSVVVDEGNPYYDSRENCNAIIGTAANELIVGKGNTVIPASVTSIVADAFSGCTGLTEIVIPNSVTSIGSCAFKGCTNLAELTISSSVREIFSGTFNECKSLSVITCLNPVPPTLYAEAFPVSTTTILRVPDVVAYQNSDWTNYFISFNFEKIENAELVNSGYCGDPAVNGGMDVTWHFADGRLTISGTGAIADYYEWDSALEITEVVINEGVTGIGDYVFSVCDSLASITIPASVTSIGNGVLYYCPALASIVVNEGNTVYDSRDNCNAIIRTAQDALIVGCQNTVIPNTVWRIQDKAFSDCHALTEIAIPNSVREIGSQAFFRCSGLVSVAIPNSVTSIYNQVFQGCESLKEVTIPSSVTSIGDWAFSGCNSISLVTCLNPVPPTLRQDAFSVNSETAVLRVPDVEAYKASDWAKYFSIIVDLSYDGIGAVEAGRNDAPATIHDLGGRRVTEPVKGRIYIVDGKTVVW